MGVREFHRHKEYYKYQGIIHGFLNEISTENRWDN